ncbi:MAG: HNH endonuclease signature motif containing protein [bacterium]|nr:HNH endonuclease signature motif containing protein [bacterium]
MKSKREVSENLGRTQHRDADKYYAQIKKRIGAFHPCPFYSGKKYKQFSKDEHDKRNPNFPNPRVPIEQFDFQFDKGKKYWKLQAYCKVCYKAYRRARIELARVRWAKMTDTAIRRYVRMNIPGGKVCCSVCKKRRDPNYFPISRSMETGLHNECVDCASSKATSVREQAWLSDGDWSSWKRKVIEMRKEPLVVCAGWPPAVASGRCRGEGNGKRMHADHKVPLRAGGINDARNFQPLCSGCNATKSDQLDTRLSAKEIRNLVGSRYRSLVRSGDSIQTTDRRLKAALWEYLENLEMAGQYLKAIKAKKREVNGQWDPDHAHRKGVVWIKRDAGIA